ncbi:MAG: OpgC domain-containing protein [Beijerinckiaceae bacterium]|nr:OpgC domain-containing protein [Beijerinckiaceae bacterium]
MALVIIFITHIPGLVFAGLTPRAFGFADAAEAFVLLAGLAAYFAYAPTFLHGEIGVARMARGSFPIFTRVWQLYITHVALVLLVTGILAYAAQRFGDPDYLESGGLDILLSAPADAVRGIVTLTFLPHFLDILPLYILFLAGMPLVLLALRLHWMVPLAASLALYGWTQVTWVNIPNINASSVWFFNPFAWQILFVTGIVVSHLGATGRLDALFARRGLVRAITALALVYVIFTFLAAGPWRQIASLANVEVLDIALLPLVDKTNLTPLRLLDAFAKFWLLAVLIKRSAPWLASLPARVLILAGRHSLPVFVLGLVLSTIATVITKETAYVLWVQALVVLAGTALMIGFAGLLDWQAGQMKSEAAARAAQRAAPAATAPGTLMASVAAEPSTK